MPLPWWDEVYIVELGRLFLCGGDSNSIVMSPSGSLVVPVYYIGPCFQELAFRFLGDDIARILPLCSLGLVWWLFRRFIYRVGGISRASIELYSLAVALSPLLFQSALLARIDAYVMVVIFAAMALFGPCQSNRRQWQLAIGAFLSVVSLFIWPSAVIAFPIILFYCVGVSSMVNIKQTGAFVLWSLLFLVLLLIPVLPYVDAITEGFLNHTRDTISNRALLVGAIDTILRETIRSPFLASFSCVGLFCALRLRKKPLILSVVAVSIIAYCSALYSMRFVYVIPLIAVLGIEALAYGERRFPRFTRVWLVLALIYGLISGPISQLFIEKQGIPDDAKEQLSHYVGEGQKKVFTPDYTPYYIGRELGWTQLAYGTYADNHNLNMVSKILKDCDAVVVRDFGRYETVQYCGSIYGLLSRYLMWSASKESSVPNEEKSLVAKIGERFAGSWGWRLPLPDFKEVGRVGCLKVYMRNQ